MQTQVVKQKNVNLYLKTIFDDEKQIKDRLLIRDRILTYFKLRQK